MFCVFALARLMPAIAFHRGDVEALHEVVVLRDFGFGEVQVHIRAFDVNEKCENHLIWAPIFGLTASSLACLTR